MYCCLLLYRRLHVSSTTNTSNMSLCPTILGRLLLLLTSWLPMKLTCYRMQMSLIRYATSVHTHINSTFLVMHASVLIVLCLV